MTQAILDYALREFRECRAFGIAETHARRIAVTNAARRHHTTREAVRVILDAALAARYTGVEIL